MMTEAIGLHSRLDLAQFKTQSLIDIMNDSTDYTRHIANQINQLDHRLAAQNTQIADAAPSQAHSMK